VPRGSASSSPADIFVSRSNVIQLASTRMPASAALAAAVTFSSSYLLTQIHIVAQFSTAASPPSWQLTGEGQLLLVGSNNQCLIDQGGTGPQNAFVETCPAAGGSNYNAALWDIVIACSKSCATFPVPAWGSGGVGFAFQIRSRLGPSRCLQQGTLSESVIVASCNDEAPTLQRQTFFYSEALQYQYDNPGMLHGTDAA
jgi:hypothetical protein